MVETGTPVAPFGGVIERTKPETGSGALHPGVGVGVDADVGLGADVDVGGDVLNGVAPGGVTPGGVTPGLGVLEGVGGGLTRITSGGVG